MTTSAMALEVRGLERRYDTVVALAGLDLRVAPGEVVGLLGPNGAGKTTALECITGLRKPDAGTIRLGDLDARGAPVEFRRRVGALLQRAALPDALRAGEAVALFAALAGVHRDVPATLRACGLAEQAGQSWATLSGGQQRRLSLALAALHDPVLLVLDEPAAGLDPQARHDLHERVRAQRAAGRAVLLSTHDLDEARSLCDRILILHRGRSVGAGTPAEVARRLGGAQVVVLRGEPLPDSAALAALPAVTRVECNGDGCRLTTHDAPATLAALLPLLAQSETRLIELHVGAPSLEQAFLAMTGGA